MFGSEVLEVIVGMIFIFLLVSILCTAVREGIEGWLKTRAAFLVYGIREMLYEKDGKGLAADMFKHPLISSLFSGSYEFPAEMKKPRALARGRNLPTYIPSRNFALALLDIAARGKSTHTAGGNPTSPIISFESLRQNLSNIEPPEIRRMLLTALDTAKGDLDAVIASIEEWYNSVMDRVGGWYKRSTGLVVFMIGLLLAVGMNINAVRIGDYLYRSDSVREALLARAEAAAKDNSSLDSGFEKAKSDLAALHLPIGWDQGWVALGNGRHPGDVRSVGDWWSSILGWLITAFATLLGAPFWFDLLKKCMAVRSTIKPGNAVSPAARC